MNDLLFDTPLWLLGLLLAAGIALWWSGNNRQDKTLQRVGLGVLLMGVALAVVSFFMETDKELVTRQTKTLVKAVNERDWATFESTLDERSSFIPLYNNREQLVAGAKDGADRIGLKSVRVLGMNVLQKDTVITVDLNAYSEQERSMGRPVVTSWRFDWQDRGTGWKLQTITPLKSQEVNPDEIVRNLR